MERTLKRIDKLTLMTMNGVCEILIPHLDCNDLLYKAPCPPPFMPLEDFIIHARNQNITDGEISAIVKNCGLATLSSNRSSVDEPKLSANYDPKTTPVGEILTTDSTSVDYSTSSVEDARVDITIPYEESTVITVDKYTWIICFVVTVLIIVFVLTM